MVQTKKQNCDRSARVRTRRLSRAGTKLTQRFTGLLLVCICLSQVDCLFRSGQRFHDFTTPLPVRGQQILVLGFLGGWEPWDNEKRWVRKLALKLRAMAIPGVCVETVENHRRALALELIRRAFDRDGNGVLDAREKSDVRLILYGQSFGGAAVVKLARELNRMDVPVLLTVQIDSIGRGDAVIPPNVARAANLFQREGLFLRGQPEIRPEDPARTVILGNFRYDYRGKHVDLSELSWIKRKFQTAHDKMDFDPAVWMRVERLILDTIIRAQGGAATESPDPAWQH